VYDIAIVGGGSDGLTGARVAGRGRRGSISALAGV